MLIREFSTVTTLPVQVKTIAERVIKGHTTDEITYIGVDVNAKILMGMNHCTSRTVKREGVYADPVITHDIYTANSLTVPETRLVQTKELMHILDPEGCKTAQAAEFDKMVQGLVLPPGLSSVIRDGIHAAWDRVAILQAVAVLLPMAARNLLLPKLNDGKLSLAEIAGMADLPDAYVAVVMSPVWDDTHALLLNLNWPQEPRRAPPPAKPPKLRVHRQSGS
jgi:hypothetical protein